MKPDVLILEDEMLIGLDLAAELQQFGVSVVGPFPTMEQARRAVAERRPAAAFLDINLGRGVNSAAFALELQSLGVPFAFLSGYAEQGPDWLSDVDAPRLSKPISAGELIAAARRLLDRPADPEASR
jgi:DNA-binding response OmpR family regulator